MPRGDRTGPLGQGPRTGRGMGYCAGYPVPGFMNSGPGFGFSGFGRGWEGGSPGGRGRGYRHWYYATGLPGWARFGAFASRTYPPPPPPPPPGSQTVPKDQEGEWLRSQAQILQEQLEAINKRLGELETEQ